MSKTTDGLPRSVDNLVRLVADAARPDRSGSSGLNLLASQLAEKPESSPEAELDRVTEAKDIFYLLQSALDIHLEGEPGGMHQTLRSAGYESWSALAGLVATVRPARSAQLRELLPVLGETMVRELKRQRPTHPKARCEGWAVLSTIGHPYTVAEVRESGITELAAANPWRIIMVLHASSDIDPDARMDVLVEMAASAEIGITTSVLAKGFKLLMAAGPERVAENAFLRHRVDRLIGTLDERNGRLFRASLEGVLPGIIPSRPENGIAGYGDPSIVDFAVEALNQAVETLKQ